MAPPLIGITTNVTGKEGASGAEQAVVNEAYIRAVVSAGGLPVLIPAALPVERLNDLLPRLQGVVLSGGGDVDPRHFNGTQHPRVYDVIPERDDLEIGLAKLAARDGVPFLGICRGAQVINVALGGTLYTHISDQLPDALDHEQQEGRAYSYLAHAVDVLPGSRLAAILGAERAEVNSLHHQGIEIAAPGLEVSALAPDGLAEAVELRGHPFGLAVQWHPEWLQDQEPMRALFRAFVAAAAS